MDFCFVFGIFKSLQCKLSLVYIEESGFEINNNYLCMWKKHNEAIFGGPKKEIKKKN